jgi:hypothetical protein
MQTYGVQEKLYVVCFDLHVMYMFLYLDDGH